MPHMTPAYPYTRTDDTVDTLCGVPFADSYRWLETESAEVRQWEQAQSDLADAYVRDWPHFDRLRQLVERFGAEVHFDHVAMPLFAAGKWFRTHTVDGASRVQAIVSVEPMGEGRVVFDTFTKASEKPPFLSWIAPSPDGLTLALGLCVDGSENNTIRLVDVVTGRLLADPPSQLLMDSNAGGVQWLSDSSGFFFTAINGTLMDFDLQVYLHSRQPAPTTVAVDVEWTKTDDYRMVVVSREGRHALALERCLDTIPVAVARLDEWPLRWRPFVTSINGTVAGEILGERYIAVTNVGAPRGRVVAIELNTEDPNDPRNWQELVPESDAILRTVTPVGNCLYLSELVDTYARVRIVNLEGQAIGEVPLPGRGAVVSSSLYPILDLMTKGPPDRFLFAFSRLTVSRGVYSHAPGQSVIETWQAPQVRLENAVVEEGWASSADGTPIPYHLVRRADADTAQPRPTLICAYGGYGAVFYPQFPGPMAAFVAAGGVFVHTHIRGGGEFGLRWWQHGRMEHKQNGYDDLYSVAEGLIRSNRTTPQLLAVTGESNGGLMTGVALTQRPALWAAAVPRVPMLDLVGACRYPYGRWVVTLEYADIEDPVAVRRLGTISPYNLVRKGVSYPGVFLDIGATDPRSPPWHARKFAARLQHATAGSAPILLRVWEDAGHGGATRKDTATNQYTAWLAFVMRSLGLGDAM